MAIPDPTTIAKYVNTPSGTNTTTGTASLTQTAPVGTVLQVYVSGNGSPTFTVSDSKNHTWTPTGKVDQTVNPSTASQIFTTTVTTEMTTADTITATRSSNAGLGFLVLKIDSADGTFGTPVTALGSTRDIVIGPVPSESGSLVCGMASSSGTATGTTATSPTVLHDSIAYSWANGTRLAWVFKRPSTDSSDVSLVADMQQGYGWGGVAIEINGTSEPPPPTGESTVGAWLNGTWVEVVSLEYYDSATQTLHPVDHLETP